ncbi:MAG TPA: sodium:proton antiporter, partial [Candidatus Omnitrophota bacterium]|nr:sodium:proton antiporter [Candidatus Omnitrophota bacterium]
MVEIEATGLHRYFSGVSPQVAFICVLPFILLLLSIAILPLALPHFWEKNRNKAILASLFGLPVAGVFLYYDCNLLIRTMLEYGAFIGLLGSLFIISGGIYIRGSFKGTPLINTVFFAVGAVLANFIGTTGASMLLIRPLIRANQHRHYKVHT